MKTGILLAAFGTASVQGETTLRKFADNVREQFPNIPVRWAFTSSIMRQRLAHGSRKKSDSVGKALRKMAFERFNCVALQPLHVVPGIEYENVLQECSQAARHFRLLHTGTPLLSEGEDMKRLARALLESVPHDRAGNEAVLFVGHGSQHDSATRYAALAQAVQAQDPMAFVATMKGEVQLEHIGELFQERGVKHVWLLPLLAVIGRHALEDLAGSDPDSWRSQLQKRGFACTPVLYGMVESQSLSAIWIEHLAQALSFIRHP